MRRPAQLAFARVSRQTTQAWHIIDVPSFTLYFLWEILPTFAVLFLFRGTPATQVTCCGILYIKACGLDPEDENGPRRSSITNGRHDPRTGPYGMYDGQRIRMGGFVDERTALLGSEGSGIGASESARAREQMLRRGVLGGLPPGLEVYDPARPGAVGGAGNVGAGAPGGGTGASGGANGGVARSDVAGNALGRATAGAADRGRGGVENRGQGAATGQAKRPAALFENLQRYDSDSDTSPFIHSTKIATPSTPMALNGFGGRLSGAGGVTTNGLVGPGGIIMNSGGYASSHRSHGSYGSAHRRTSDVERFMQQRSFKPRVPSLSEALDAFSETHLIGAAQAEFGASE